MVLFDHPGDNDDDGENESKCKCLFGYTTEQNTTYLKITLTMNKVVTLIIIQ